MDALVCAPNNSLVRQSLHACEGKTATNGDGFGLAWYGDREEPGLFRDLRPAWSDENLRSLCGQVRSPLFFAHVRAATNTATTRANCHPFVCGRYAFMHNGQIGSYRKVRRKLEALLPDELFDQRAGTTDSELLFLLVLARMELGAMPGAAVGWVMHQTKRLMLEAGIAEAVRFTAILTDGQTVWAFRTSCDGHSPGLYLRERPGATIIASEPLDTLRDAWSMIANNSVTTVRRGLGAVTEPLVIDGHSWPVAA
ncbi:glutamine amidotransferase [Pseudochelatococcus lubricantis]|uniref:Glutamine amidotransferase n=2 Tax=Pseudochelatococcus lubricantis TaxID=1538102 RepID=A0ABX0V305_9HYPH|nr:class II glutamine amidotransferase [Pseudochelatococcus lubricantis]NIJ59521.1 glutamine amidotransferase [Pseudochelatococcus lubricantis]